MYACLDLGSNSFHLLIADYRKGHIDVIERFSAKVQLGEGLAVDGRISDAAFERGLHCLDWFRDHLRRLPVSRMWAVGTNALRQADNAPAFLIEAARRGFDIDVVSGEQEAALVYAGVTADLPDDGQHRLVIDIGGGSTELVVGRNAEVLNANSLAMGCVSWRDRYFGNDQSLASLTGSVDQAMQAAGEVFAAVRGVLRDAGWQSAFASSGTARMLASVCAGKGAAAGEIRRSTLMSLKEQVLRVASDSRYSLTGVKTARRDVLLSGWCIMLSFMEIMEIETLRLSDTALREGMLCALAGKVSGDTLFERPQIITFRR